MQKMCVVESDRKYGWTPQTKKKSGYFCGGGKAAERALPALVLGRETPSPAGYERDAGTQRAHTSCRVAKTSHGAPHRSPQHRRIVQERWALRRRTAG